MHAKQRLLLASSRLVPLPRPRLQSSDLPQRGHADLGKCSWSSSSPYHNFTMCIRSLSEMAVKLDELYIFGGGNGISYRIFSPASRIDYDHLLNVSASLRKMHLNVETHCDIKPLRFENLGRFITHAQKLQSLDLHCSLGKFGPTTGIVLSQVFQDFTWPHLKHFGLYDFSLYTNEDLIAFFDRHRATLDSVSFKWIYLRQQTFASTDDAPGQAWRHLFGQLRKRSINFQKLTLLGIGDRCSFQGKWPHLPDRANRGPRVLQYLRDGGVNPFTLGD